MTNPEYEEDLLRDGNVLYTRNGENIRELLTQQRQVLKWKQSDVSTNNINPTSVESQDELSRKVKNDEPVTTEGETKASNI